MDGGFETKLAGLDLFDRGPALWSPRALLAKPDSPANGVFNRDLSEAGLAPVEAQSLTDDDIEAARRHGYAEGYQAGQADAEAAGAALERQALAAIADVLSSTGQSGAAVAEETALSLSRALFKVLSLTMPDLLRRSGLGETQAFFALILPGLSREPLVSASVPSALATGVAEQLRKLGQDQAARVAVTGDDALRPGEVRVNWNSGSAHRAPAEIWRSILDAFEPHLGDDGFKETTHAG
jgi:flagellar biosynthesis/type III secretory pathway protein FliH